MSKQLVILVHGMGTHAKGNMTKEFKQALKDRADSFSHSDNSFINDVDYKEFNYSEDFDIIRKQFADNAAARKKGFGYLTGKGLEEKLIKQLSNFESNFGKDEFYYTHWLDVILYSTMYFGEKIRVDFISFFEKMRNKYDHKNIHVICHSLGTALVHDALAKYYRVDSTPYDNIPDVKVGDFNISSLWTFANVSRMVNLLNGLDNPNHSTVVTGPDGCTSNFINVRNKYDPFTWFKQYDRRMDNKYSFVTPIVRKINTHDFYEYVTEPKVTRALLTFIYDISIGDDNFKKGVKEYKKTTVVEEAKELKLLIDDVSNSPSITTVKSAVDQFKKIQKTIDSLIKGFTEA